MDGLYNWNRVDGFGDPYRELLTTFEVALYHSTWTSGVYGQRRTDGGPYSSLAVFAPPSWPWSLLDEANTQLWNADFASVADLHWLEVQQKVLRDLEKKLSDSISDETLALLWPVPTRFISLTWEEICEAFKNAQNERATIGALYSSFTDYLHDTGEFTTKGLLKRVRKARRRIYRRIVPIFLGMRRSVATFCSLLWSDRIWYLLHGSHPPKAKLAMIAGASCGGALAV